MLQPTIVRYNEHKVISLPAGSIGFDTGDLLSFESNALVLMDAAGEDATFAGIAVSRHETGVSGDVTVAPIAIVDIGCSSATYGYGDGLLYVSGSGTVEYVVADDSSANTIMWAYQEYTTAVTRLVAIVSNPILQKLFSSAA